LGVEVKQMASTTVEDTTAESHAFRTLVKVLLVVGIISAIVKFLSDRRKDFYGLTEAEARAKFESKLGPIIGEDRAAEVADQVIPRLKESGVLEPDFVDKKVENAKNKASDLAHDIGDKAKDVADDVGDATKKAVDSAKDVASDVADKAGDTAKKATDAAKDTADKVGKKLS
jgi:gas vesicle protein